jgi:hypothetical protein
MKRFNSFLYIQATGIYLSSPDGNVLDELVSSELLGAGVQEYGNSNIWLSFFLHRNFDVQRAGGLVNSRLYDDHLQ